MVRVGSNAAPQLIDRGKKRLFKMSHFNLHKMRAKINDLNQEQHFSLKNKLKFQYFLPFTVAQKDQSFANG